MQIHSDNTPSSCSILLSAVCTAYQSHTWSTDCSPQGVQRAQVCTPGTLVLAREPTDFCRGWHTPQTTPCTYITLAQRTQQSAARPKSACWMGSRPQQLPPMHRHDGHRLLATYTPAHFNSPPNSRLQAHKRKQRAAHNRMHRRKPRLLTACMPASSTINKTPGLQAQAH